MRITKKTKNKWAAVRSYGDNQELSKILKMTDVSVSRILSGSAGTSLDNIEKINSFFTARSKKIAKIENDLN